MEKHAVVSIYHDARHQKLNGRFPVKLRIYQSGETKLYNTNHNLTKDEFNASYLSLKPRGDYRDLKLKLVAIEQAAASIAKELRPFSFEKFESRMFSKNGKSRDVIYYYQEYIQKLDRDDRAGTSSNYSSSLKSLLSYLEITKGENAQKLPFERVSASFLENYERWMVKSGNSLSTVGIYLRPLRAIYNMAIAEGDADQSLYPFKRYSIPASRNVKKALSKDDLKIMWDKKIEGGASNKARDFWFFSYQANGMNIKDICELKFKNLSADTIVFTRSKTLRSTIRDSRPIVVVLTDFLKGIVDRYGNKDGGPDDYVFPILKEGLTGHEKRRLVQNFTRFINENIKELAKECGLNTQISTYWARHSFTTVSIREGASMEFIQDSLGHSSLTTTQKYWAGFEAKAKKDFANRLLEF